MQESQTGPDPASNDSEKQSIAWKALAVLMFGVFFALTAAWLVLVARGIFGLVDWLWG